MPKSSENFSSWLAHHGAEILPTTNPWEQVRWRARGLVGVLYKNGHGQISFNSPLAEEVYMAFSTSKSPVFHKARTRLKSLVRDKRLREVISRDGEKCCFCGKNFSPSRPPTLEHLLSKIHGGPDHIANLAAAHQDCNTKAGSMTLLEKINLICKERKI